jgi:hypothetical protein
MRLAVSCRNFVPWILILGFALLCSGCGGGGEIRKTISTSVNSSGNAAQQNQTAETTQRVTYIFEYDSDSGKNDELRSMLIDGTNDKLLDSAPILSRMDITDESNQAYYIRADDVWPIMAYEVYSVNTGGGAAANQTNDEFANYQVQCMDNGTVYTSSNADIGGGVYQGDVYRLGSSGATQITNTGTFGVWFKVSPNEDYIVYLDSVSSAKNIYYYNVAQATETLLASQATDIYHDIAISSDGNYILYFSNCSSTLSMSCRDMHVIDTEGNVVFEQINAFAMNGVWAPDSTRFVVTQVELDGSDAVVALNIYAMPSGGKTRIMAKAHESYIITDWSSDGTLLLGMKSLLEGENSNLFVMNPDGSNVITLTVTPNGQYAGLGKFSR